jgi:NAD(P)-dependent dehydrogenase (short-subunit alcohol dehydrogenase family)
MPEIDTLAGEENKVISQDRFAGRVALVTGGAAGIGLATARALAQSGATAVIVDIDADKLVAANGDGQFDAVQADVTRESDVTGLIDNVMARHGRIDVLVNLAGVYGARPMLEEQTLEGFRALVAANLDSAFLCCQKAVPHMRAAGYGRIVNTASGTFHNPQPGLGGYVAAKGGVIGLTRVLAKELGAEGITVNVIMPGLIATQHVLTMLGDSDQARATVDGFFAGAITRQSVKRRGEPDDVAHAILFLADERSGFVTGQTLQVDGGSTFI